MSGRGNRVTGRSVLLHVTSELVFLSSHVRDDDHSCCDVRITGG